MEEARESPPERFEKHRMLRHIELYWTFVLGTSNNELPERVRHTTVASGWSAEELDELYLEFVRCPAVAPFVKPGKVVDL